MRIMWISNAPWAHTGYGNQTNLFVPRLQKIGHEVAVTAFYGLEGGSLNWNGIPIYPKGFHPYGNDVMSAHAAHFHANIMITLIDAWVYDVEMIPDGFRWAPWFPVDHEPMPNVVYKKVSRAWARIVYSRFAEQQVNNSGLDCYYVPHGVDTNIFRPGDMAEARDKLGFPNDKFIVGIVAANKGNPSRKAFAEQLLAFAEFKEKHPDSMMYLHTVAGEENAGVNLPEYLDFIGLTYGFHGRSDPKSVDVLFNDQYQAVVGLNDVYMATVYNALDVFQLVTMGEGFGIPLVEAQACGCPVITSDWTATSELCFSGWKVDKKDSTPLYTPIASWQYIPSVGAIVDRLEAAYRMKGNEDYRKAARKGSLAFDADKVVEKYWRPTLDAMADEIAAWSTPAAVAAENELENELEDAEATT